jgi:hypothetical protein
MKIKTTLVALLAATALTAGAIQADMPVGDDVHSEIEKILTDLGYQVLEIEAEDDGYEVLATAPDGTEAELELDASYEIVMNEAGYVDEDSEEAAGYGTDAGMDESIQG